MQYTNRVHTHNGHNGTIVCVKWEAKKEKQENKIRNCDLMNDLQCVVLLVTKKYEFV